VASKDKPDPPKADLDKIELLTKVVDDEVPNERDDVIASSK
jgi:hypothetical protein